MQLSKEGLKFLEQVEGKSYIVYPDSEGYPTVGIGHKLTKKELRNNVIKAFREDMTGYSVYFNKPLTDTEIYDILRADTFIASKAVNDGVAVDLSQNQYDALVSFVFNTGITAFRNSTLLKVLNSGDYLKVPTQLIRWVFANHKVVNGLVNRRTKEIALWENVV